MNFKNLAGGALFVGALTGGAYGSLWLAERYPTQYVRSEAKAYPIPCDSFLSADNCKNVMKESKVDTVLKHIKKPTMKLLK